MWDNGIANKDWRVCQKESFKLVLRSNNRLLQKTSAIRLSIQKFC